MGQGLILGTFLHLQHTASWGVGNVDNFRDPLRWRFVALLHKVKVPSGLGTGPVGQTGLMEPNGQNTVLKKSPRKTCSQH